MSKRATKPFKADWKPMEGLAHGFSWGKKASYWKGEKGGWWATRQGVEGIHGPFKRDYEAKRWAEEPFRKEAENKVERLREQKTEQAERMENKALQTWGNLPSRERVLKVGQVWVMKDPRYPDHQLLLLSVRKDTVVALVRKEACDWSRCPKDVRSIAGLLRTYRYAGSQDSRD